jgi:ribose transport system substrate-binding protein
MKARRVLSWSTAATLAAGTCVAVSGCGSSSDSGTNSKAASSGSSSSSSSQAASTDKQIKVALITYANGQPYVVSEGCGAKAAAAKYNVKLTVNATPGVSASAQLAAVNSALQARPDGLLVDPNNPTALNAALKEGTGNGVKLVSIDGQLSQKIDAANIRTDNLKGGALAADALGAALNGKGLVAVEALAPSAVYNAERVTGFVKRLKEKYPNIQVLPTQYDNGDANTTSDHVSAQIQAHPELAGVYAAQQTGGEGAVSALKAAGKAGSVKVVSYDADPSQVDGLRNGNFLALVGQSPYDQGYKGTELLAKLVRKQIDPSSVTYQQYSPVKLLTKDNVDQPGSKAFHYVPSC